MVNLNIAPIHVKWVKITLLFDIMGLHGEIIQEI